MTLSVIKVMKLHYLLQEALPIDKHFEILHLQSVPTETSPIVTQDLANEYSLKTIKTQHFFSVFHNSKVFFGLEIYVYITLRGTSEKGIFNQEFSGTERQIFISKADTNGYCETKVNIKEITKAILTYILSINPNYYLKRVKPIKRKFRRKHSHMISKSTSTLKALKILSRRRHIHKMEPLIEEINDLYLQYECPDNIITKISLFTRPAEEYLFSESSKNQNKHVLNGDGLLKWWISILDYLVVETFLEGTEAELQIPGEEPVRVKRYIRNLKYNNWKMGNIFGGTANSLAVFKIPLFPDDPKSRFLHQLVEESRISNVSMHTFWTELQERQEFKLSVTVSVIGVAGSLKYLPKYIPENGEIIVSSSKKQFKYVKGYITGEDYDTDEGALDAFANIRDYLLLRLNKSLMKVKGKNEFNKKKIDPPKQVNIITVKPRKNTKQ